MNLKPLISPYEEWLALEHAWTPCRAALCCGSEPGAAQHHCSLQSPCCHSSSTASVEQLCSLHLYRNRGMKFPICLCSLNLNFVIIHSDSESVNAFCFILFKTKRMVSHMYYSINLQGLSMRQIRFRFDGQPINEADTPAQV